MKKLFLSFLLVSLFLIQAVLAEDFSISVDQKEEYFANREDSIIVMIKNPMTEDWFTTSMFGVPPEWVKVEEPLLRVQTAGFGRVEIKVNPSRDALPGIYQYFLKVTRVSTESEIEKPILLNIKQVTSAIIKDVSLSCSKCLDKVTVTGTVYNVGSKTINAVLILKVANVQKTIDISKLKISEKREFETSFSLGGMEPKQYKLELELIDESGNSLYKDSYSFEIPSVEEVYYGHDVSSSPFGSIVTLSATNRGNVFADVQLASANSKDWYYFISGPTPSGMFLENYAWKASLAPGETYRVTYSEIYWPTYVFIVAIVLVFSFFYWQTSDIVFSKDTFTPKELRAGKDISVSLYVKNRKTELKRVTVRDLVPSGFSLINKFETAKPLIRKVGMGIELLWDVGRLNPHEERFFHYTIKPRGETYRRTSLPSAILKALGGRNFFTKRTNLVSLSAEKAETNVVTVKVEE